MSASMMMNTTQSAEHKERIAALEVTLFWHQLSRHTMESDTVISPATRDRINSVQRVIDQKKQQIQELTFYQS
jgi:hypothetical protein